MTALAAPTKRTAILWAIAAIDAVALVTLFVLLGSTSVALATLFVTTLWACVGAANLLFERHRTVAAFVVGLLPVPLGYAMAVGNAYLQMAS